MKKLKIYVSHSIRGKFGTKATKEQMADSCKKAVRFGNWLKENFPDVEWYVPAVHDEFVSIAYFKKYITEKQILDVDCELIKNCDGLLIYALDNYISRGMQTEKEFSYENNIPVFFELSAYLYSENDLPTKSGKQKIECFIKELKNGS